MAGELFFYLFATLMLFGGGAVVFSRNPVNASLYMILSLVSLAALFLILDAFFLAVLQVLVYAGAVMVLFLFVIMLLDVDERERSQPKLFAAVIGLVATGMAVAFLLYWMGEGSIGPPEVNVMPTPENPLAFAKGTKAFGYALLTKYMLPVQVAGFLLLVAMIGVILIGRRKKAEFREGDR
ncbi:MAG: NADH-quinone oxidoreductase subunit J [Opitutales bacterium]